jgi:GUN4-like
MPTTNKEREIRIAQKRVEGFAQQFGEAHRNLARHAAFPLVLTPDLLYQIWANFVPEAPWTAVAHVLLSRLCRQVGYEMYEMDIADRNLLLRELKGEFGQERFDELGEFLLDYVAQRFTDDDADTRDLREAQEWTALAYTKPDEAARELAQALSQKVQQEDMGEVLRLASLFETLAEPLVEAGFEPLLVYARGMGCFVRQDFQVGAEQFAQISQNRDTIQVAGVSLAVPTELSIHVNDELLDDKYSISQITDEQEIDYTHLQTLLAAGKWKEADRETARLLLKIAKPTKEGRLTIKDIENFPCKDLLTLDKLWIKHSNGRFGFSVQKEIYKSLGGTRKYNIKIWEAFSERVGWRMNNIWLSYNQITFSINAPVAHLPIGLTYTKLEDDWRDFSSFAWRLDKCNRQI